MKKQTQHSNQAGAAVISASRLRWTLSAVLVLALCACEGESPKFDELWNQSTSRVRTATVTTPRVDAPGEVVTHQRPHLLDDFGRYIHIRGLNVSGSHKAPPTEIHLEGMRPSRYPLTDLEDEDCRTAFPIPEKCIPKGPDGKPCTETDTCEISYVDSPFSLEDADKWFGEMARLGFNNVRLITNWESIQPYRPNSPLCKESDRYTDECYDLEYLEYYEKIVAKAKEYGIYVLVDMHQDIFSRHMMAYYSEDPTWLEDKDKDGEKELHLAEKGTLEHFMLSLTPPYTDWVRGHGAPRWIVETCLPEKDLTSEHWGMFRSLGALRTEDGLYNDEAIVAIQRLFDRLNPGDPPPVWFAEFLKRVPAKTFAPYETSDFLPFTPWLLDGALSLDSNRCFAALFAGDKAFPDLVVDTNNGGKTRYKTDDPADADLPDLKTYMQNAYINAWKELAKRTKKYDHVIGYDVMNEPVGVFLVMTIAGAYKQLIDKPPECEQPVHCIMPKECKPGEKNWPGCAPDGVLSDKLTPDEAYDELLVEAAVKWACHDENGFGPESGEEDVTRWCRKLQYDITGTDPLTLHKEPLEELLFSLVGEGLGADLYGVIRGLELIPRDTHPHTMKQWGIDTIDMGTALDMNFGFDANYLQPFYENVGKAIESVDPNAIIWFEPSTSIRTVTGPQSFWDLPLTRPQGIKQLVFAPHWYPDIYPRPGFDSEPREFNADEWLYRDFTGALKKYIEQSSNWLGNVPVVFGEFGTYFNFNGIEASKENDYAISAHVLNGYYEAFESLGMGNILWCFSASNNEQYGESWNHEDFSIIGPDGEPRAWPAYVRTYVRAASGKIVKQRFVSQFHFWDPVQGEPRPERSYDLEMELKETEAPTEIFVPKLQYPDGFYVWLSDGTAFFDSERQVLYWYPSRDKPNTRHKIHIEPIFDDREALGWSYFFKDGDVAVGAGDAKLSGSEVLK